MNITVLGLEFSPMRPVDYVGLEGVPEGGYIRDQGDSILVLVPHKGELIEIKEDGTQTVWKHFITL